jgi:hypothetical protein
MSPFPTAAAITYLDLQLIQHDLIISPTKLLGNHHANLLQKRIQDKFELLSPPVINA